MVASSTTADLKSLDRPDRYLVTADQYRHFRRWGYLVVPQLVSADDVAELRQHTDDLMQGRLPEQRIAMPDRDTGKDTGVTMQTLEAPPAHLSPDEKAQFFLRIHMLHRQLELHERYMLHPRVLDVLEVIIGPDVLAMQTMLFLKPPGKPGQGWHQDSYYIPTHPDTLCGAWIAIDDCDEFNGAMWMAKGSAAEPVYPPCPDIKYGFGDNLVSDIQHVKGVSDTDDAANALSPIADKYDQVLVPAARAMWSSSMGISCIAARSMRQKIATAGVLSGIIAMQEVSPNGAAKRGLMKHTRPACRIHRQG